MTNQVRVFLSSTFIDFERERELIHLEVKPTLDDMASHFGLNLEISDLRWGVTRADLAQQRTAALCLQEVDLCRRISPEANFLVLLGDRAGSRVLPTGVPFHILQELRADLAKKCPHGEMRDVDDLLRLIFPARSFLGSMRVLRDTSDAAARASDTLVHNPDVTRCLLSFACDNLQAEQFRQSLALSITHQEVLRSGALAAKDRNRGAAGILRSRDGVEPAQVNMRARVTQALGSQAACLEAPAGVLAEQQADYEVRFVRCCTALLGEMVRAARERGSRSRYFQGLWAADPPLPTASGRHIQICARVADWSQHGSSAALAIVGGPGAGKTNALYEAAAELHRLFPDARFLSLKVGATPDLQNLRTFVIALIHAVSHKALDDARLDEINAARMPDLVGLALASLREVDLSDRLFLLVDDLDLIATDEGAVSVSWLWSGAVRHNVLFTAREWTMSGSDVEVVGCIPLTEPQLIVCAQDMIGKLGADWLVSSDVAKAAIGRPHPGYVRTLVRIAHDAEADGWQTLAKDEPEVLISTYVDDLIGSAPFSETICHRFLALCLIPDAGVSDVEFLAVCQDSNRLRSELEEHFPQCRFIGSIPRLVWHRLTEHFNVLLEQAFRAGGLASRVQEQFAGIVRQRCGAAAEEAVPALADLFLTNLDRADARAANILPRLLDRLGRHRELATLALTPGFMKQVIAASRADPLLRAIGRSTAPDKIVAEIVAGIDGVTGLNPSAQSHWLLDLSVLARELGFGREAASLALMAHDIRRSVLGDGHSLTIAACLEATDSLLEARRSEEADRLCRETLASIEQDRSDRAISRLKLNHAAALSYLKRPDEAERIIRAVLPHLEGDVLSGSELQSAYNMLAVGYLERGALEEAETFASHAVDTATRVMGRRSRGATVCMVNLAMIHLERGAPARAIAVLDEVLSIYADSLDPSHPWVANAQHMYFRALSDIGRHRDALVFMNQCLAQTTVFELASPWIKIGTSAVLRAVAAGERVGVRELYDRVNDLIVSSPDEAWTGELVGRSARLFGAAVGLPDDDGKGVLVAALLAWILVVLAAVRENVVLEADARDHIAMLELRAGQIYGLPVHLADMEDKIRMAWSRVARDSWAAEEQLFRELAPRRNVGLIDAFKGLGNRAASVEVLGARAREAQESAGSDPSAGGEALIMLAARAAATGKFDVAISAQADAAAVAGRIFGRGSPQWATAILNLGSLYFRAEQYNEAFDAYRQGLERLYVDGAAADRLGQALENAMAAGFKSERLVETGQLLEILADRSGNDACAIGIASMACVAFMRAQFPAEAIAAFNKGLAVHATMPSKQAVGWAENICGIACMLSSHVTGPHKRSLIDGIEALEQRALAGGWQETLSTLPIWARVRTDLNITSDQQAQNEQ
jgi:tetratricopeptide (TPR) repeat protein